MTLLVRIVFLMSLFSSPAIADEKEVYRAIALEVAARIQLQIPIGMIMPFAGHGAIPDGYVECNGQELSKGAPTSVRGADYRALHSIIGDDFTPEPERVGHNFRVPDLTGRTLLGAGKSHGHASDATDHKRPERKLGEKLGADTHTLTIDEMPSHTHSVNDLGHAHTITQQPHTHSYTGTAYQNGSPGLNGGGIYVNGLPAAVTGGADANIQIQQGHAKINMEPSGNGHSFSTLPPSLGVRYLIRWKGITHGAVDAVDVRQSEDTHLEESHEIRNPASSVGKAKVIK